MMLFYCR
jgi:hypothetical protein